jgi:hypothetical protein
MGAGPLNGAAPLAAALAAGLNGRLEVHQGRAPSHLRLPGEGEERALVFVCKGALWSWIHDTLERPAVQRQLICADVIGYGGEPAQAARDWFDCVMMRPLTGRPIGAPGRSHELAALLLQRGLEPSAPGVIVIRDAQGLEAGGRRLADALSLWDALSLAPEIMYRLRDHGAGGAPSRYRMFLQTLLRAVEAANESWKWIVQLGLHPKDWSDTLSINSARSLVLFFNEVRRQCEQEGGREDDVRVWARAWQVRRPSGFGDVDALIASDVGRAVRSGLGRRQIRSLSSAHEAVLADSADDDALPGAHEFARVIDQLEHEGALSAFERGVLEAVFEGATLLDAIARAPGAPANLDDPVLFAQALSDRLFGLSQAALTDRPV